MIVLPAIVIVTCGIAQQWPTDEWLGVESPKPVAHAGPTGSVALGDAISTALARHPDATLAIVELPSADNAWYRIRLRKPGELRRVYGTTTVYVDAHDGSVLLDRDAPTLPLNERISNAFYPIHTGEFAGVAGRFVVLFTGLGLLGMATLGACLWWTRRQARSRAGTPLRPRMASR
jgi:uncharacterized iron-regulated membrane protein